MTPAAPAARIVVGVDGSPGSLLALRWAVEEAGLRHATVEAVHAWHYPYVAELAGMPPYSIAHDDLEEAARSVLRQALDAVPATTGVPVEPVVMQGDAAGSLVERAKGADLLVVGSRGRGGFAGLLLGSVGQQCAHHAPCPVTIVPEQDG